MRARTAPSAHHPARPPRGDQRLALHFTFRARAASATRWRSPIVGSPASSSSAQDLPGQELFQYLDTKGRRQTISSDDVNAYLRETTGRDITAKDFRTWAGTMLAAKQLCAIGPAKTRREAERNMLRAIDTVADRLGNTRAVCRKYYVHPGLLRAYLQGLTVALPSGSPHATRRENPPAALRRDEVRCCNSCRRPR